MTQPRRRVDLSGPTWWVCRFPFDARLVSDVRDLGAVPVSRTDQWTLPANPGHAAALIELGFTGYGHPDGLTLEQLAAAADRLIALSSALDLPGYTVPGLRRTLMPHQRPAVAYGAEQRRLILADPMGAGKTFEAWAIVHATAAYPTLWVSPAKVRTNAAVEAVAALPDDTRVALVLPASTPAGKVARIRERGIIPMLGRPRPGAADVYVTGYPLLHHQTRWWTATGLKGAVIDESQMCKSREKVKVCPTCDAVMRRLVCTGPGRHHHPVDRQLERYAVVWTRALDTIIDSMAPDPVILALSGTPNMNTNADWPTQLHLTRRLGEFGGERTVLFRYCDPQRKGGRWQFRGGSNYEEFDRLKRATGYVHRTREAILPTLPPLTRTPILVDCDDADLAPYLKAEADLVQFAGDRAAQFAAEAGDDPTLASWEARLRTEAGYHLIRFGTLARLAAVAKLPAAVEWIDGFLAADPTAKLVVFAHHREGVLDELGARYPHAGRIDGSTTRDPFDIADEFQTAPEPRLLIVGITAGGVGLTLTAASTMLFLEEAQTSGQDDQAVSRCYGRVNDAHHAEAVYLLAADTVDENRWEHVAGMRVVNEAARSGDPVAIAKARELKALGPVALVGELLVQMARRSGRVK